MIVLVLILFLSRSLTVFYYLYKGRKTLIKQNTYGVFPFLIDPSTCH